MEIRNAKFVVSSPDVSRCPDTPLPEFAFIGRSNVGKSSLINMLTGQSRLAMTSSTPGKTLLINHFLISSHGLRPGGAASRWHLVDLPGYGYAQRGKEQREQLRNMIEGYILHRAQMMSLFLLIDIRLTPQRIDLEFIHWLGENDVPFSLVFTKADKVGVNAGRTNINAFLDTLKEEWEELPPVFVTSSPERRGKDELLQYIASILKGQGTGS